MNIFSLVNDLTFFEKVLVVILVGTALTGIWLFLSAFIPRGRTKARRTVQAFEGRSKAKAGTQTFDSGLTVLSQKIAPYIHLDDIKRAEYAQALQITNNSMTPEEYQALCYISGGVFFLIAAFMGILGLAFGVTLFTILAVGAAALGGMYYFRMTHSLKKDKEAIVGGVDKELPRFVSFLNSALQKQNTSILSLIERYTPRNDSFAAELEHTIADAKTSNFTSAMARWDQRINSERLKRTIRGLINANNGDDVRIYFAMLERDFNNYEITMLKQNIKKIPEKMRLPKMLMYSAVALALFFPILMQVLESFSLFFMN